MLLPDEEGAWRLLGIPSADGEQSLKRLLPAEWAGLVDEELSRAVGIPGAKFCHKTGRARPARAARARKLCAVSSRGRERCAETLPTVGVRVIGLALTYQCSRPKG